MRALAGAAVALAAVLGFGAELRIGNGGEPLTLDPHRYNLNLEEKILANLFEGLTAHDAHGRIVPGAARSWSTSEDGLKWTFHLREDARWSDGAPVTAEDFVYSFRRLMAPRTAASLAYFLYAIDGAAKVNAGEAPVEALGVTAHDAHTLEIRLAKPFPFLAERLIYPTGYPVPKHVVEGTRRRLGEARQHGGQRRLRAGGLAAPSRRAPGEESAFPRSAVGASRGGLLLSDRRQERGLQPLSERRTGRDRRFSPGGTRLAARGDGEPMFASRRCCR